MKKVFVFFLSAFACVALFGCNKTQTESKTIRIQFVPSQEASIISAQAPLLEALLEAQMPGFEFVISVGTDYNAVIQAMEAGQCEVGFLTAQQYAQASVETPGKVEPILTSVRSAYQVQIDYPNNFDKQIKAMNGVIDNYQYAGQQAVESVTYYNSICIVKKDSAINSAEDLAGKSCSVQKTSSGAGYVYPAVLLNTFGMKFVTGAPNAANKEVKAVQAPNYPTAVSNVLDGNTDAAWIFLDVRYTAFYNNVDAGTEYYQTSKIFDETKVVAMTTGIYNDTISVISSMKSETKTALQNAFIALAADKSVNGGADILYKIYSHTGYMKAVDADYQGERDVYNFKKTLK